MYFWISWRLVLSRDSKPLVCLQRSSMPLACLLSLMEKASRDKRVCLQIWFCKDTPSLAQLQQQTDMHQDPRSHLIKHLLYSDSKSPSPPAQHLRQTTTLYLSSAAQVPVLRSHECREQEDHSSEHMVIRIIADILSPMVMMESNGPKVKKICVVQEITVNYLNDFA